MKRKVFKHTHTHAKSEKYDFRQSLSVALIKGYFWTWTVLPPWLAWGRHSRVSTAHRTKRSTLMLPVCSGISSSSCPFTALPAFRHPEVCAGFSHRRGGPTRPERDTLYSPKCSENPPPAPQFKKKRNTNHAMHPESSPAPSRRGKCSTFTSFFFHFSLSSLSLHFFFFSTSVSLILTFHPRIQNMSVRSDLCRRKREANFVPAFFLLLCYDWRLSERISFYCHRCNGAWSGKRIRDQLVRSCADFTLLQVNQKRFSVRHKLTATPVSVPPSRVTRSGHS